MAFYDPLLDRLVFLNQLKPANLKKLGNARLSDIIDKEAIRARRRVDALHERYPSAQSKELAQRLIDQKKNLASMVGGISGVFGVITLPADLLLMVWLQLSMLVDLATLHKVSLKSERARKELLDVFGYANGIGPMQRASPKVLSKLASVLLQKGGFSTLGKAMPLVAAPISAYLNNHHIQQVGDHALRHYNGFERAQAKTRAKAADD
jgi:hypothetical protein